MPSGFGVICYVTIVPRIVYGEAKCSDQKWLLSLKKKCILDFVSLC